MVGLLELSLLRSRNSAELVGHGRKLGVSARKHIMRQNRVFITLLWACGPPKWDENQATLPNEDFALVVTKSRACPTPTVRAGHARRCMSLPDIKGE